MDDVYGVMNAYYRVRNDSYGGGDLPPDVQPSGIATQENLFNPFVAEGTLSGPGTVC